MVNIHLVVQELTTLTGALANAWAMKTISYNWCGGPIGVDGNKTQVDHDYYLGGGLRAAVYPVNGILSSLKPLSSPSFPLSSLPSVAPSISPSSLPSLKP